MNGALTISVRIKPTELEELRKLLTQIGDSIASKTFVDFSALKTTHFLRWAILDQAHPDGEAYMPELMFESNYDGPLDGHLDELVRTMGPTMSSIYEHCERYPVAGERTMAAIIRFWKDHSIPCAAFFCGYPGRTVAEIAENTRANRIITAYLEDNDRRLRQLTSAEIRQELLGHLDGAGLLEAPVAPLARTRLTGLAELIYVRRKAALVALGMIALILLPLGLLLLAAFGIFVWVLRRHEKRDVVSRRLSDSAPPDLAPGENHTAQNAVTHVVRVKPGRFRRFVLRGTLWALDFLSRHLFIRGMLGSITTIHHARWVLLGEGDRQRLLFMGNYDGTWEHYLGEFVDLARIGVTAVWSNTCDFPPTRYLIHEGAKDEDGFKQWALNHQLRAQVWYTAHPDETVKNILNSAAIRGELREPVCGERLKQWLKRL
jgi:hypothetical protein